MVIKANNKYMEEYDKNAPSKYVMCLDVNNFGPCLNIFLPVVLDGYRKRNQQYRLG